MQGSSTWQILVSLLQDIVTFAEKNWSGLAVLFWNYEERKIDERRSNEERLELEKKTLQNELDTRKKYADMPSSDIVRHFAGSGDPKTPGSE